MKFLHQKNQQGYIALMSVIIICLILLAVTSVLGMSNYFSRFNVSNKEYKRVSVGLAESCVNVALLEIAKNPSVASVVDKNVPSVGCKYTIDNPLSYDSENKKTASVIATAQYPANNGAFSNIKANLTIYDPQYSSPSKIIVNAYSYGDGAKTPDQFSPFKVGSREVSLGQINPFDSGVYNITETLDSDYDTYYSGDCDSDGKMNLGVNDYQTCSIINTLKPQTASLTIIISSGDGTLPSQLSFNNNNPPLVPKATQKITVSDVIDTNKTFPITVSPVNDYDFSDWSGTDCSGVFNNGHVTLKKGDNKVCAIALNKRVGTNKAAVTIVTRVVNNYGGTAQPNDFLFNITATNPSQQPDVNGAKVYFIDPGDFEVSQTTALPNYKAPEYINTSYPYLCSCKNSDGCTVAAGRSYLCVITNTDIATTFTLTATVNITRAWGIAPVPNFTLALDGTAGHKVLTSGVAQSGLPAGNYSVSIIGIPSTYSVSQWGGDCSTTGAVSWSQGEKRYKTCAINIVENPPPSPASADTVIIFDRTGSITSTDFTNERAAGNAILSLYSGVTPTIPQVGMGSFGGLSGNPPSAASIPTSPSGWLTNNYGTSGSTISLGPNYPAAITSPNNWTNPDYARANDSQFATDATNGHQQGYNKFGFNIPSNATIQGIEVIVDGKASPGNPQNATVYPNAVGNFNPSSQWGTNSGSYSNSNKVSAVNDTNNPDNTYITTSQNTSAQTFKIDTSAIPAGSTINSIMLNVRARKSNSSSNATLSLRAEKSSSSYTDVALGALATSFSAFSGPVWTKDPISNANWGTVSNLNNWGFGVVKSGGTSGSVRVSQVSVTINYTPPANGSLAVNLSWNNGTNWLGTSKTATLNGSETAYTLGGAADTWTRTWSVSNFSDGNFVLRIQNNATTGSTLSVNYITAKIYYTIPATGLYATLNTITGSNSSVGTDLSAAINAAASELSSVRHNPSLRKVMILVSDGEPNKPSGNTTNDSNAALVAADNAKIAGVEIFTVRYSQDNQTAAKNLLAQIATGNVANGTHQPGSANDKTTAAAENSDGDHFYISPQTAADMQQIFHDIGTVIITPPASPPSATKGTLNIITHVINNNSSHTKTAADFQITVSGSNPTQTFAGAEAPGVEITLNPGAYNVTESTDSDYVETIDPQCSGNIVAGQEIACIIINDDAVPSATLPLPDPPLSPPSVTLPPILVVVTQVDNSSGTANKTAADFMISIDNPSAQSFAGSDTGDILDNLNPGDYTITPQQDPDGKYSVSRSPDCSGNIAAAQTRTCVIIYTASPPPPPPIEIQQNIYINSWIEIGSWSETP